MHFHETRMGQAFFEHHIPKLICALETIGTALARPCPAVKLPAEPDPMFLHDLYFGRYEPEVFKVTEESRRLGQAVNRTHGALAETMPAEGLERLTAYEKALSEQSAYVTRRAFESGVQAAVQMILAGLPAPGVLDMSGKEAAK